MDDLCPPGLAAWALEGMVDVREHEHDLSDSIGGDLVTDSGHRFPEDDTVRSPWSHPAEPGSAELREQGAHRLEHEFPAQWRIVAAEESAREQADWRAIPGPLESSPDARSSLRATSPSPATSAAELDGVHRAFAMADEDESRNLARPADQGQPAASATLQRFAVDASTRAPQPTDEQEIMAAPVQPVILSTPSAGHSDAPGEERAATGHSNVVVDPNATPSLQVAQQTMKLVDEGKLPKEAVWDSAEAFLQSDHAATQAILNNWRV